MMRASEAALTWLWSEEGSPTSSYTGDDSPLLGTRHELGVARSSAPGRPIPVRFSLVGASLHLLPVRSGEPKWRFLEKRPKVQRASSVLLDSGGLRGFQATRGEEKGRGEQG